MNFQTISGRRFTENIVAVLALLLAFISVGRANDVAINYRGFDELRDKLEGEIAYAKESRQFIRECDLIRLYVETFPYSVKSPVYLEDLVAAKKELETLGTGAALTSKKALVFLGSHCYMYPNSDVSIKSYDSIIQFAEESGMPMLGVELRARVLSISKDSPGYDAVRSLAGKAYENGRGLVALNSLSHFQNGEYNHDGFINLNLGPSLLLSGDIFRKVGFFNRAISKYKEALQWCGDMRLKGAVAGLGGDGGSVTNDEGVLVFNTRSSTTKVFLNRDISDGGILKIQTVEKERGALIPKMLDFELTTIERNAKILIGRALIEDARSKTQGYSTTAFAGKLYEKAVGHFVALLEPMSLNDYSSIPFRLELLRASIELARYKNRLKHGGMSEAVMDYALCVSNAESFMRMVEAIPNVNEIEDDGMSFMGGEAIRNASEVAYILVESLFEIGRADQAFDAFSRHYSSAKEDDPWAVLAMLKLAEHYIEKADYMKALPLLTSASELGGGAGVRDLAFVAGLMKGICIKHLNPNVPYMAGVNINPIGEDSIKSGTIMADRCYGESVKKFKEFQGQEAIDYPGEFRYIFLDEIRDEVEHEFRVNRDGGELVKALLSIKSNFRVGENDTLTKILSVMRASELDNNLTSDESEGVLAKPFGGFHVNVITGAKYKAMGFEEELNNLGWNPFVVTLIQ